MDNWVYIPLIFLNSILVLRMIRDKRVNLFLKILLGISYFGWNALPLVLSSFTSMQKYTLQWNRDLLFFCNVANQAFLFFVFFFAYVLIRRKQTPKWCERYDFQEKSGFINVSVIVSLFFLILSIFNQMTSTVLYTDFNLEEMTTDTEVGPYVLLTSLCRFFLLALILFRSDCISRVLRGIIVCLLIIYYILFAMYGGRIALFGVLIMFLYLFIEHKNLKHAMFAGVFLFLAFLLLPVLGELRQSGSRVTASQVVEKTGSSTTEGIIREITIKTNSVDYSSFLLTSDGIGNAGIRVYSSQLYSLIPRFIYPDKPYGSSKDGTPMGEYARYAASIVSSNADSTGYNVGTSTSIVSLWTLGWPMYILQIFISGFFIWLLNCVFNSKKLLFIAFVMFSINYPACLIDISLDILIRDIQRWLVLYLLLRLVIPTKRTVMQ